MTATTASTEMVVRLEPVVAAALLEHVLQRRQPDGEQGDARPVHVLALLGRGGEVRLAHVLGLVHEACAP